VDDSEYVQKSLKALLEDHGFEVIGLAPDGKTAIDMACSQKPDIITLDNILPGMTGQDVLWYLKNKLNMASKIIMISAMKEEEDIQDGLDGGAFGYIVKPFSPDRLIAEIDRAEKVHSA